jgi:hypothetical protein
MRRRDEAAGGPLWAGLDQSTKTARRDGSRRINRGNSRASRVKAFAGKAVAPAFKSAVTCDLRKKTFVPSFWNGRRPERRKLRIVRVVTESILAAASVSMKSLDIVRNANRRERLDERNRCGDADPEPFLDIAPKEPTPACLKARGEAFFHLAADGVLRDAGRFDNFGHGVELSAGSRHCGILSERLREREAASGRTASGK